MKHPDLPDDHIGEPPILWKTVGDEVLFTKLITDHRQVLTTIRCWLGPGISGEIRPDAAGGFVIRINRHDPAQRQRFTVAHELAHYLLHRDEIGTGIEDDVLYRSSLSDRREQQANRLAADILMPGELLADAREAAEEKGVDDVVLYPADLFAVSEAAMRIKVGR